MITTEHIKSAVAYGIGYICGKHNLVILESKLEEVCSKYADEVVKNLNVVTETKPTHQCDEFGKSGYCSICGK